MLITLTFLILRDKIREKSVLVKSIPLIQIIDLLKAKKKVIWGYNFLRKIPSL